MAHEDGKPERRGGARIGAGRPKGSVNKSNELARLRAAESGELPLDFMLRLMRDPNTPDLIRIDMAKAAAPYLHARLQAVTHSSEADNPIMTVTKIERVIVDPGGWQNTTETDTEAVLVTN